MMGLHKQWLLSMKEILAPSITVDQKIFSLGPLDPSIIFFLNSQTSIFFLYSQTFQVTLGI